uniref:Nuclear protein, ataxia-telangiectasia locus n=1 Tax=Sparus aurata TaxID=8175 RepID=A0A671YDM5_SPAAU
MLLPSDVARLVLGYLQEEGLSATSQAFIHESPNLKEYADHTLGDGAIPACVFSVFGKGLTTILNEYMATKTKESCHEVPAVMTSLWKKLDFTLNQINFCIMSAYNVSITGDSPIQVIVSEHRLNPGPINGLLALKCVQLVWILCDNTCSSPQQLVIQNARDRILGDRSLQEKLAENINKILASDPVPQTSKISSSTVEADQSIDEILGLQGEIHMSDDAIHDILEQTESDPAFQALYDLFDYSNYDLLLFYFPFYLSGTTHKDANASDATSMPVRPGQERKTRKSTAPTLLKKTFLGPNGRASRIENSAARLLVSQGEQRGASSAAVDYHRKGKASPFTNSVFDTPMEIDEPLNTPPPPLDSMESMELPSKGGTSTTAVPLSGAFSMPASSVDNKLEPKQAQGSKKQPASAPLAPFNQPALMSSIQIEQTTSETSVSTSATLTASTSPASSSCAPVDSAPDLPTTSPTTPSKSTADSNIVSLKIIISDNQDEGSSSDLALTQAISSIAGDKIPTIYLSSPAKSPVAPGTPKANLDEAAQAVSGLQSSEVHASPLCSRAGALLASPLTGTSQVPQNYIIQLPLDTSTPALQGATASYFLVTDPTTTDAQNRQVLLSAGVSKGQPMSVNQFGVATPTSSQGYSTGSTLILPSPVKPMMLPVSVVGQNTLGKVQMVSNQVTRHYLQVFQLSKFVQPVSTDKTGQQDAANGPKHKRILCFESSAEVQQQTPKTTRAAMPPATNTSTSRSVHRTEKDNIQPATQTRPNILGGNKPKRRVQTVKCSADPRFDGGFMKDAEKSTPPQQHQKDPVKKNPRKQDHGIHNKESQSASTSRVDASQPEALKKSESGHLSKSVDRKHSHDKDGDIAKAKDSHSSRSLSSDSALKSGTRKEKDESSRKEPAEKAPAKSREGRSEKRTPCQETPNVTANKENEIKVSVQEQSTPSSSASRDFSPPAATQPTSNPQSKATKAPSKTSSLAKQAAEMLHDIQGLSSPPSSAKKPVVVTTEPAAGHDQEQSADSPRTPCRQKKGKDGEGTPKHLKHPNTPDVPNCSPASEAGSENSINMAAHTLMILSRAAIARTGTPLKDSLRQEGVGEMSSAGSKNSKKRKLSSPKASPPAKKDRVSDLPFSGCRAERKKLMDCFPHDLDVDKFLSSLHYDE